MHDDAMTDRNLEAQPVAPPADVHAGIHRDATRERLLDVAERCFAERGIDGTSIREITREAGANVASVHYHFRDKQGLYEAVYARRMDYLRDYRVSRIQAALARPGITLEGFLTAFAQAFVEPLMEQSTARISLTLMNREMMHPRLPPEMMRDRFMRPLADVLFSAVRQLVPSLDNRQIAECMLSMVAQLLHAVQMFNASPCSGAMLQVLPAGIGLQSHVEHIVRFTHAGILAYAKEGR